MAGSQPDRPAGPPSAGGKPELVQEARETLREIPAAVAIVVAMQLVVAWLSLRNGWTLFHVHGWIWWVPVVPELVLLGLVVRDRRNVIEREGVRRGGGEERRRNEVMALLAIIAAWNAATLVLLILELFTGEVRTGGELMIEATVVFFTLVLSFGLIFWELDGGGPPQRALNPDGFRDFLFSQMTDDGAKLVRDRDRPWFPRLVDYAYLAFVTAIAWSAADALPVSRRAKLLMAGETAIAALTILLVAARAIGIFG